MVVTGGPWYRRGDRQVGIGRVRPTHRPVREAANRGVWESGWWLGPTVSLAHTVADVDHYVDLFGRCLADLVATDPVSA